MNTRSLWVRLPGAYARSLAKWFGRRPFSLRAGPPLITFTFDDFPRSALSVGGTLLEHSGLRGTYFVAHGLMGRRIATGEMFTEGDLPTIQSRGHELGCHTYHHHPAWETATKSYASSVIENALTLNDVLQGRALQTHSYPISYPRPATKRRIERRFRGCRGGGQTFNNGTIDLNYLSSFFLEQSLGDFAAVEGVIASNAAAGGWLIFSTHDVDEAPTRFGCTPAFFAQVVRASAQSGAQILPMSAALDALCAPPLQ